MSDARASLLLQLALPADLLLDAAEAPSEAAAAAAAGTGHGNLDRPKLLPAIHCARMTKDEST